MLGKLVPPVGNAVFLEKCGTGCIYLKPLHQLRDATIPIQLNSNSRIDRNQLEIVGIDLELELELELELDLELELVGIDWDWNWNWFELVEN